MPLPQSHYQWFTLNTWSFFIRHSTPKADPKRPNSDSYPGNFPRNWKKLKTKVVRFDLQKREIELKIYVFFIQAKLAPASVVYFGSETTKGK